MGSIVSMLAGGALFSKDPSASQDSVKRRVAQEKESLLSLYRDLHAAPELSFQEEKTSARMAQEMRAVGFEVTEKVGGWGVVAVLRNGPGKTMLVRTDMDALPVREITGLPYASKVSAKNDEGKEVSVMHACGHDVHMACWVGTARVLASMKDRWQRHAGLHRPAGRGEAGRRGGDAEGRVVREVSQARPLPRAA